MDPKLQAELDALRLAFMQARGSGRDFNTAMPNISPDLLAALSAADPVLRLPDATGDAEGPGQYVGAPSRSISAGSGDDAAWLTLPALWGMQGSGDAYSTNYDPNAIDWGRGDLAFGVNTDLSNFAARYGQDGRFLGYEEQEDASSWKDFITAMAIMAGGYYGGTYLSNAYGAGAGASGAGGAAGGAGAGGAAGGGGAAAGGSSITLPTTAEMAAGMTPASASAAAGAMPAVNIAASGATGAGAGAAAGGGSGGTAGSSGVNSMRAGEIAGYSTNGTMPSSAATVGGNMTAMDQLAVALNGTTGTEGLIGSGGNMAGTGGGSTAGLNSGGALGSLFGGNGNTLGGLLGAYLGYQDSKDKENTSKTEPWGPAQPYLKGLLGEGASLYDQYKQQPFSPAEQTAYGNYGNTLDFINANAGGLMSGFDATARGANQFSRNNPRRGLIGNSYDAATSPVAWQPGLLSSFGTRKG